LAIRENVVQALLDANERLFEVANVTFEEAEESQWRLLINLLLRRSLLDPIEVAAHVERVTKGVVARLRSGGVQRSEAKH